MLYRWADRVALRQEVLARLKRAPDPDDARLPTVDLSYAAASLERCK